MPAPAQTALETGLESASPNVTATARMGPIAIAVGDFHSCALLPDGVVKCWGSNTSGQVGNGTTVKSLISPVSVTGLGRTIAIAAGGGHTCALVAGGTVMCWGDNSYGQLGDGTTDDSSVPVAVAGLTDARGIAAGGWHTCALVGSDGTVKCWGMNGIGQLGDGTTTGRSSPVAVEGLTGAQAVTAGRDHSCALVAGGTVMCWGSNGVGQLGDGTITDRSSPVAVAGISGALDIAAGSEYTCALLGDHRVACWGDNYHGQLGNGTTTESFVPVTVSGLSDAQWLAVGGDHACVIVSDAAVRCWGSGPGNGEPQDSSIPVELLIGRVTAISAGSEHTCALQSSGMVWCWGRNQFGQLGDGTTTDSSTAFPVLGL
jgi:alpha-tubulin suppressor-like RCC1 family protein